MSIKPRIVDRSKDKTVQLHMRIQNDEDFAITGKVVMEIVSPEKNIIWTIEKVVMVEGKGIVDEYFNHETAGLPKGRFMVNGKFLVGEQQFVSETHQTDFFDVVR